MTETKTTAEAPRELSEASLDQAAGAGVMIPDVTTTPKDGTTSKTDGSDLLPAV